MIIQQEGNIVINSLLRISTVDEKGKTDDDAYQDALEQHYYVDELYDELRVIEEVLSLSEFDQQEYFVLYNQNNPKSI